MQKEYKLCRTCRHSRGCSILGALYCAMDDSYIDENDGCDWWEDCYFL